MTYAAADKQAACAFAFFDEHICVCVCGKASVTFKAGVDTFKQRARKRRDHAVCGTKLTKTDTCTQRSEGAESCGTYIGIAAADGDKLAESALMTVGDAVRQRAFDKVRIAHGYGEVALARFFGDSYIGGEYLAAAVFCRGEEQSEFFCVEGNSEVCFEGASTSRKSLQAVKAITPSPLINIFLIFMIYLLIINNVNVHCMH